MNLEAFEDSFRQSALFSHPAASADAFADQLADVVTMELDKLAPVRTGKQRRPKSITRWLSKPAIAAKRRRRRLEKAW